MNGPAHYRAAENITARILDHAADKGASAQDVMAMISVAQVHATLAHAAAVWDTRTVQGANNTAWGEAISAAKEAPSG